ncbi:MAG: hypothetical protein JXA24_03865 [Proteobacteria bacterium]|nr:hypothetical protein [Pseudomonadota bacterium]
MGDFNPKNVDRGAGPQCIPGAEGGSPSEGSEATANEFVKAMLTEPPEYRDSYFPNLLAPPETEPPEFRVYNLATGQMYLHRGGPDSADAMISHIETGYDVELPGARESDQRLPEGVIDRGGFLMTPSEELWLISERSFTEVEVPVAEGRERPGGQSVDSVESRMRGQILAHSVEFLNEDTLSRATLEIMARHGEEFLVMDVEERRGVVEHVLSDIRVCRTSMEGAVGWEMASSNEIRVGTIPQRTIYDPVIAAERALREFLRMAPPIEPPKTPDCLNAWFGGPDAFAEWARGSGLVDAALGSRPSASELGKLAADFKVPPGELGRARRAAERARDSVRPKGRL